MDNQIEIAWMGKLQASEIKTRQDVPLKKNLLLFGIDFNVSQPPKKKVELKPGCVHQGCLDHLRRVHNP